METQHMSDIVGGTTKVLKFINVVIMLCSHVSTLSMWQPYINTKLTCQWDSLWIL